MAYGVQCVACKHHSEYIILVVDWMNCSTSRFHNIIPEAYSLSFSADIRVKAQVDFFFEMANYILPMLDVSQVGDFGAPCIDERIQWSKSV